MDSGTSSISWRRAPAAEEDPPETPRDALTATPWLRAVPGPVLDGLAAHAVLHRLPAGSIVFEQAETPAFAQFLIGGSVELLAVRGRNEAFVELIRPFDLLLPAAVLNCQPYLLRARVLSDATLLLVQADTFREAVTTDHAFCLAVLSCQAAQFRRRVKQVKNLGLRSAEERVGCYLVRLAEDVPPGQPVRLPMEKRLIASELGMTRETFSRSLNGMARHGIRIEGDLVTLEHPTTARTRFALDPLIDGAEEFHPLQAKGT
ncbi:CRP/FNR family transcriptional regulator, transcriptional activator FtrB [Roseomonas rosea]|uniref:CRP/FNR family transcriptional regulator, transcriptional activator FtrB n=1 Tax=Muricoccus roseus TaxID=198092 RepID=A0A1M6N4W0_9PROT|nr:helix-turn-helix domain-containing protein [Roseomonas rosea]SHJ90750.1 CRP/FNR family transcriptional regulator, transcriptional activator FtrB [Roseomonas rosea]